MRYRVYKLIIPIILVGLSISVKAQVFGAYFYITLDSKNYNISAYGIDKDHKDHNEEIKLGIKEIRGINYDTIWFSSFKYKELDHKQLYETIFLKISKKRTVQKKCLFLLLDPLIIGLITN